MLQFINRLIIRSQMRHTAERIEQVTAERDSLPARYNQLDEELQSLWQRAKDLREEEFWIGRKPSMQACAGKRVSPTPVMPCVQVYVPEERMGA